MASSTSDGQSFTSLFSGPSGPIINKLKWTYSGWETGWFFIRSERNEVSPEFSTTPSRVLFFTVLWSYASLICPVYNVMVINHIFLRTFFESFFFPVTPLRLSFLVGGFLLVNLGRWGVFLINPTCIRSTSWNEDWNMKIYGTIFWDSYIILQNFQ